MRHRWWLMIVLCSLIAVALPVRAEVYEIDPQEEPEAVLDDAELEKLAALQNPVYPTIESPISPDDTTILVSFAHGDDFSFAFLNIQDGSRKPISGLDEYPPESEVRWRDPNTLAYLSSGFTEEDGPVALVITIDRTTNQVASKTIELVDYPISLAPDGYRLLVEVTPPEELEEPEEEFEEIEEPESSEGSHFDRIVHTRLPGLPSAHTRSRWNRHTQRADGTIRAFADEPVTLAVLDLRNGAKHDVMTLPDGGELQTLAWSQDANRLALTHTSIAESDNNELLSFVLSNQTTQDALGRLAPEENPFFQSSTAEVFDLSAGVQRLSTIRAPEQGQDVFGNLSWSSDGQTLLAQMWRPGRITGRRYPTYLFPESSYLRFYRVDGTLLSSFTHPQINGPYTTGASFISPDEVILWAPLAMSDTLHYYNRVSGEFRTLPLPPGTVNSFVSTRLSRQIVYGFSSYTQPPDLYRVNWDGSAISGLTFENYELASISQIRADRVTFALGGGKQRSGYLVQPAGAPFPPRNARIVVWQEGGPGGSMLNTWGGYVENPFSLLPNFGIAVLVVPLPGREGNGPAFLNALADRNQFGEIDIDEQAAIVRQMIARGWTAPGRVGITGCSYGGYFTTQSLVRHPGLYAAANTQCSWVETIHDWQFIGAPLNAYLTGTTPSENAAEYIRNSPLYNATKIRTPLLIFHGSEDFQPLGFMETLHDELDQAGVPVELLTFIGEGHGLYQPSSQLTAGQAQINWFRQYLE